MAEPAIPLILPLREDRGVWPPQGQWTYEDYLRLPDDGNRYEVIEGFLYVSPAPGYDHQFAVAALVGIFREFVLRRALGAVLAAPFDVKLPGRKGSPVEPDVLFIRSENLPQPGSGAFEGVPDLIAEVLSPGTRRVDERVKLDAYREAGVPEYWLVDPQSRTVLVYCLSEDGRRYLVFERGGPDDVIGSAVLAGLRVRISDLFPPAR